MLSFLFISPYNQSLWLFQRDDFVQPKGGIFIFLNSLTPKLGGKLKTIHQMYTNSNKLYTKIFPKFSYHKS